MDMMDVPDYDARLKIRAGNIPFCSASRYIAPVLTDIQ
jgi:hypothetical protein